MISIWFFGIFVMATGLHSTGVFHPFETNINANYFPEKGSLKITFDTVNYTNSLYNVEVLKLTSSDDCLGSEDEPVWSEKIVEHHPVTEVYTNRPLHNGTYCIRVTPLKAIDQGTCVESCRTVWTNLTVTNTDVLDCQNWSALLKMGSSVNQQGKYTMKVAVILNSTFDKCFEEINVSLWLGSHEICDSKSGDQVGVYLAPVEKNLSVAIFEDLNPGNYCVRLYTKSQFCRNQCSPLFSGVEEIPGVEIPEVINSTTFNVIPVWLYTLGTIFFLLFIIIFIFHKLVLQPRSSRIPVPQDPVCEVDPELVLLYSRDFSNHTELVASFHDFIIQNWEVKCTYFDIKDEMILSVDPHAWVDQITDQRYNRLFLIVESEGAVLQEEGRKHLKVVKQVDEDFLDTVFPHALQMLKNKIPVSWNHRTVFVAKFRFTSEDLILKSFTPNRRYIIPDHLFDLYCDLLSLKFPNYNAQKQLEQEKMNEWAPFLTQKFIPLLERVENMLNSDPRLIRKLFSETELPFL